MDYEVSVAECGDVMLKLNLCKEHGTITGNIRIALEPLDAQSIGEDLIHHAFIADAQSQKSDAPKESESKHSLEGEEMKAE